MKKTVYIARTFRRGDCFDVKTTYRLNEAREALKDDAEHLTTQELKGAEHYIDGYTVEVQEGETAEEAYNRLIDEDEFPYDPDYYEELAEIDGDDVPLTSRELDAAVSAAPSYADPDAYVSDMLLSSAFLGSEDDEAQPDLDAAPQLVAIWQTVNAPFREFLKLVGLRQSELSRLYFIPLRTVQGWALGEAQCAAYIRLMIARLQGYIR